MIVDRSKQALMNFLESMGTRGHIPAARVKVWLVAIRAMLSDLSPEEDGDVRKLDVNGAFQRSINRDPNRYGASTIAEYRNRITQAMAEFEKWANDPEAYRYDGVVRTSAGGKTQRVRRSSERHGETDTNFADAADGDAGSADTTRLVLQYPLRRDFLARLAIPVDMNVDEAKRLAAFIKTLATDFVPAEQ